MSASWYGSMRGPRVKTPLLPLLLLLLLTTLIGTVFCQYEDDGTDSEGGAAKEKQTGDPNPVEDGGTETPESPTSNPDPTPAADATPAEEEVLSQSTSAFPPPDENIEADQGSGLSTEAVATAEQSSSLQTTSTPTEEGLSPIIILIPVVLVVVIIGMIVCGIFINRRWNKKARNQELRKEDPYLEGSSTEKVPMPMFEEDVPSVLELEMEELDQWMQKGGETAEDSKHA